jgi:hypothetical protein
MARILLIAAAGALLATSASAAPLMNQNLAISPSSLTENVRLVCNEYGRCYRTRGPRYVQRRDYGDPYAYGRRTYVEPSYGYSERGYGGGPSIGFSFGGGRW